MSQSPLNGTSAVGSRRSLPLRVGDALFDLQEHVYRIVSLEETSLSAEGRRIAVIQMQPVDEPPNHEQAGLTRRQRQVARLLAKRATNAEIAATLGISVHTARHHSQKVLEKLGISSRALVRTRYGRATRNHENHGHERRDR